MTLNHEGLKHGYFVVKSDIQWHELWPTVDADKVPLLPRDIDFTREMLLVSSLGADILGSEVRSAVLNDREAHVYVTESELGAECSPEPRRRHEELRSGARASGGRQARHFPRGHGARRAVRQAPGRDDRLQAGPLDRASRQKSSGTRSRPPRSAVPPSGGPGSHPVFDLTWTWDSMPPGSAAKIDVAHGSRAVTFVPEVFSRRTACSKQSDARLTEGERHRRHHGAPSSSPLLLADGVDQDVPRGRPRPSRASSCTRSG